MHTIVRIKSERTIKKTLKKSIESRYYTSSLRDDSKQLNKSIRTQWGIENNLHWNLDVIFKDDGQLKGRSNSAENFNVVSKVVLALVDNEKSTVFSKPMKRIKAGHGDASRELIMKV